MARVARKILHLDMDAFYASVEQRDKPELRGRPVIVGGSPQSRGVVCTASYEARSFGVRSAMSCAEAYRRCPQGVFVRPDMERYAAVSRQIQGIFGEYADAVEPLSYDEAYLDVTSDLRGLGSATATAEAIRREVKEATGLTVSAGVAPNKFIAKVASDLDKPDGLVVVPPARVPELLATLPVRAIPGIGKVTAERCKRLGIVSAVDFLRHDEDQLSEWFGVYGLTLREFARGEDHRPVRVSRGRKQVSVEDTFAEDLIGLGPGRRELERLTAVLAGRLEKKGLRGSTVTVKVTYSDFTRASRRRTLGLPVSSAAELYETAADLLRETEIKERPVRLLGVGLGKLEGAKRQLLFPFLDEPEHPPAAS